MSEQSTSDKKLYTDDQWNALVRSDDPTVSPSSVSLGLHRALNCIVELDAENKRLTEGWDECRGLLASARSRADYRGRP